MAAPQRGRRPRKRPMYLHERRGLRRRSSSYTPSLVPHRPGMPSLRHSQGFGRRRRPRDRGRVMYAAIAVGCAALVFCAALIWYANRSVQIELNGAQASARIGSPVSDLVADQKLDLAPGDLLAVDDAVLKKGGGEPFSLKVDGRSVPAAQASSVKIAGGEKIELKDGANAYEPHEVQAAVIQPSLTVKGSGAVEFVSTWGEAGRSEVWKGKTSGKTKDRGVVKKVTDCVVTRTSVTPAKGRKAVAITFDEAPSSHTAELLRILRENDAKATFFLLGSTAEGKVSAAKAIADAGMQLGSCGYDNKDLTALSQSDLRAQLSRAFRTVKDTAGVSTGLFRAPYAKFDGQQWAWGMDLLGINVSWDVDSADYLLKGADQAVADVTGAVRSGSIVLLTDTDAMGTQTVEELPQILKQLKKDGYELLTVSELLATDPDIPERAAKATAGLASDAALPHYDASGSARASGATGSGSASGSTGATVSSSTSASDGAASSAQ